MYGVLHLTESPSSQQLQAVLHSDCASHFVRLALSSQQAHSFHAYSTVVTLALRNLCSIVAAINSAPLLLEGAPALKLLLPGMLRAVSAQFQMRALGSTQKESMRLLSAVCACTSRDATKAVCGNFFLLRILISFIHTGHGGDAEEKELCCTALRSLTKHGSSLQIAQLVERGIIPALRAKIAARSRVQLSLQCLENILKHSPPQHLALLPLPSYLELMEEAGVPEALRLAAGHENSSEAVVGKAVTFLEKHFPQVQEEEEAEATDEEEVAPFSTGS
jgi:hypothetical protein